MYVIVVELAAFTANSTKEIVVLCLESVTVHA